MPPREITREPYAALYVSAPWHTKVLSIPAEDRAAAFGFWVACLTLCQAHRNDGRIPRPQLAGAFACPEEQRQRLVAALVDAGLFDDHGDEIRIHDYTEHNRTRAEIENAHRRMTEGGRRGGKVSPRKTASLPLKPTLEGSTEKSSEEQSSEGGSSEEESIGSLKNQPFEDGTCPDCGQILTGGECWACESEARESTRQG